MAPVPVIASTLGALCAWRAAHQPSDGDATDRTTARRVRAASALLWPPALLLLVAPSDRTCPALLLPLLWPLGVWALDDHLGRHHSAADGPPPALRFDTTSVTALSFGLAGLLGARGDSRYVHLFLMAVLGCVTVVLPQHSNLPTGSPAATTIEYVQRAVLVWCIGFMIAGVVLTRVACPTTRART